MPERTTQPIQPAALGPYLRAAREKAGLSLRQLATRVGVHKSYLGRIECGDYHQPSPEVLQKLSRALDLAYADLFALTGYRIPEELPNLSGYLRSRYRMNDDGIRKVTAYVERLNAARRRADHGIGHTSSQKQDGVS